jgi:carboxypeptidase C (cathepsin A)
LAVTRYQRWLSPKFVIGESYGTTRAAALASHLQQATGLDLVGVILLSSALDFQTFSPGEGNDLPYALALPSFTAAAWYHKKLEAVSKLKEESPERSRTVFACARNSAMHNGS